jgi:hypothetical protein
MVVSGRKKKPGHVCRCWHRLKPEVLGEEKQLCKSIGKKMTEQPANEKRERRLFFF